MEKEKVAMSNSSTKPTAEPGVYSAAAYSAAKDGIENLQKLAGLLRDETDRWSRQVILAEAAMKLAELEKQLSKRRAS